MRIPFLKRRKQTPSLYQKGIENGFAMLTKAQSLIMSLFRGDRNPEQKLDFIFEQVYIVYSLALFAGSHEVSAQARTALCRLREEYDDLPAVSLYILNAYAAVACSKALKMGEPVLQELPRSEFKLAYVQAKKISSTRDGITNYLKVFHD